MTELITEATVLAWVVLVLMVTGETGAGKRWL
jgi:transcriptional regulator of aromatic amino acid metabolism